MKRRLQLQSYRAPAMAAVLALTAATAQAAGSAEIVDRMIEAHGGMEAWAAAPTVAFTEEFRRGEATDLHILVYDEYTEVDSLLVPTH